MTMTGLGELDPELGVQQNIIKNHLVSFVVVFVHFICLFAVEFGSNLGL